MRIDFVNHASVKIRTEGGVILTDPWYEGAVFNDGWDLLVEGPKDIPALIADVDYIWVSHEHPDHFAPKFFASLDDAAKGRLKIFFQKTKDRRVASFLTKQGFTVEDLPDGEARALGPHTEITCGRSEFYDSYLHVRDGAQSVMNFNDCPLSDTKRLEAIGGRFGPVDALLTQFSYAAWKGGRENRAFRAAAAREKLNAIAAQARALEAKAVIPFASFVWFSHAENSYLNDGVNTPEDVVADKDSHGAEIVVLAPGDAWDIGEAHDNEEALAFWREQFGAVAARPPRASGESVSIEALEAGFAAYREKVFAANSGSIIRLARYNPVMRGFEPVKIRLTDLDQIVEVSIVDGFRRAAGAHDAAMHSSSLKFIFDNDFGFDTLTVNGRFEAGAEGFSRLTKSFAIGSLNAMGITLGAAALLRADLFMKLLARLTKVRRKLS